MAGAPVQAQGESVLALQRRWKWAGALVRFARRKPLGAAGACVLLLFTLMALAPGLFGAGNPNRQDATRILQPPSATHWFGTDTFGRDLYSRVVYGARISMYVGIVSTVLVTMLGLVLGLVSAYYGGWVDNIIQRLMDIVFTLPPLVLALAIVAMLGPSLNNVLVAITIPRIPGTVRLVRSVALAVNQAHYMEAARAVGASPLRQMFRHMAPNCLAPLIVYATAGLGTAILTEASLSFLGMGVPPPAPSWGRMLSLEALRYFELMPWLAIFPGIAISAAVFGANLFGDALRDLLDPKLRGRM
ncbi:MAG: ABC transporter permease [Dehalococcoidia bacterium]|nr:ABC transporter permease [Dehalococcoidia bacterium]MDW8119562.1 ABC transporter permease [Chloroflexota bacterium]